jgi:hypothetical protein
MGAASISGAAGLARGAEPLVTRLKNQMIAMIKAIHIIKRIMSTSL